MTSLHEYRPAPSTLPFPAKMYAGSPQSRSSRIVSRLQQFEVEAWDRIWHAYTFAGVIFGAPVLEPWECWLVSLMLGAIIVAVALIMTRAPAFAVYLVHKTRSYLATASWDSLVPHTTSAPPLPVHMLGHELASNLSAIIHASDPFASNDDVLAQMHVLLANVTHALRTHYIVSH